MTAPKYNSAAKYNYNPANCYKDRIRLCIFIVSVLCSFYILYLYTSSEMKEQNDRSSLNYTMPWFRIPRKDDDKIQLDQIEESSFGVHFVPPNDVFIPPDWSEEEMKYLPCLSRKCVCGYFKGKWKNESCIVRKGIKLQRAYRQEIRTLSDEKRKRWEKMLNELKTSGVFSRLARNHKYSGVHAGPAFLLWHREFLKRAELIYRKHMGPEDINMGVPYWDSSLDWPLPTPKHSIFFSKFLVGEVDEDGLVKNGPYHNWTTIEGRPQILRQFDKVEEGELLNDARIKWLITNPDIDMIFGASRPLVTCSNKKHLDPRMFELSHNYVHFFINGDMASSHGASNDILFYLHHSMMDWVLEFWRRNMQTRQQRESIYPVSDPNCYPMWHFAESFMPMLPPFTNRMGLSNGYTDEMYEFAPRPTCTKQKPDCGSNYLFCYVPSNQQDSPYCVSKVRLGGNCTGFEDHPVCFEAKCLRNPDAENEFSCQEKILNA
ncbi:hypothetical protein WR25_20782 [Diploscapter pachys]|uniref:Tyrosinase copper-binding domain-containing protein n=1 Tax=Diploscapter pachys TaxID=2018661 RepID=A0A2A2KE11_9BILA|nr:hypothetical protein WR25_20782 [Diploscapter pachys]